MKLKNEKIKELISSIQDNSLLQKTLKAITEIDNTPNSRLDPSGFSKLQIHEMAYYWEALLTKQRMLVDLPRGKILLIGDIHGDFIQLRRAFSLFDSENFDAIVIIGDVVDRGPEMIECIEYLMARQIMSPEKVFFLRGNHELKSMNSIYGFRGYTTGLYGSDIYDAFTSVFQQLPLAMKIGDFAFVTHGGIPISPIYFHLMRLEVKPPEPEIGPYAELLWNDPDPSIDNFAHSPRGANYFKFGYVVFDEFMEFHELELFIRAHQAFTEGYRFMFDNRLLSIFSSKAGPYWNITPHFAILQNQNLELIRAEDVKI